MATLGEVIAKVRRILGDPGGTDALYGDALLTDGVLEALTAILPWVSKECTSNLTGNGSTYEFALPSDCAEVEAVWDESQQQFLPKAGLFPGTPWLNGESSAYDQNLWLEFPAGKISFSTALTASKIAKIFYSGYWSQPSQSTDELEPPDYALPGIAYYTAAYALNPKAVGAANVRQYNTKVDSGVPIHNPMVDMSKYMLYRFETEMSRCPARQRGQKTR
jgi:hypothetical protein